jgi:hypothetical protein
LGPLFHKSLTGSEASCWISRTQESQTEQWMRGQAFSLVTRCRVLSSGKGTMNFVLTTAQLRDMAAMRTSAQAARWQGHLCTTLPSSFRPAEVSQPAPTPTVLSLFCQLSHGIVPPKVAATVGPQQCPRLLRCRRRSWRAATRAPAPGVAPGCMTRRAPGTCIISTRRRRMTCTWSTQLALSTTATSPASSSWRCREAGLLIRRKSIMAPAAPLATPATR